MTVRRVTGLAALFSILGVIGLFVVLVMQLDVTQARGAPVVAATLLPPPATYAAALRNTETSMGLPRLEERHEVVALDRFTYEALKPYPLVIVNLHRPLAKPEIIDLDAWVREGGRALIFTEPSADWTQVQADREALTHSWGVRMTPVADGARALPGGARLSVRSGGRWTTTGGCTTTIDGLLADCPAGKGRVVLVADAHLLRDDDAHLPLSLRTNDAPRFVSILVDAIHAGRPTPRVFAPAGGIPRGLLMMGIGVLTIVGLGAGLVWAIMLALANTPRTSGPVARIARSEGMNSS